MAKIVLGGKTPKPPKVEKPVEAEVVADETPAEKPKRKRRTKAEIEAAKAQEAQPEETAIATTEPEQTSLAMFDSDGDGTCQDGLTAEDLKDYGVSLPALKLVGQMSSVGKERPDLIGTLLYDESFDLGTEVDVIVLSSQWRWQEKTEWVPGGGGESGEIMTNDEFEASDFDKDDVQRLCIMNLAVILPDPDDEEKEAGVEIDGVTYLLASLWCSGFSLDFAKTVARKLKDYGGASYLYTSKMISGKRTWKGELKRLVKWGGKGEPVAQSTLVALAEAVDTHEAEQS
jgi:hypothetical protein